MNLKALRLQMLEKDYPVSRLSGALNLSKSALYRRFRNEVVFSVPEMLVCVDVLRLSDEQMRQIFFERKVS